MCDRGGGRGDSRRWLRWGAMATAVLGLCAGGVYLFVFNPATSGIYPLCPFHALTGLYCPGCGTGRAVHQLLHGNVWAAMQLNPLAVLLLPPVAYGSLSIALQAVGGKRLPSVFIPAFWIWTLLAVILLFWALRNIPYYPFSLLAPHEVRAVEQPQERQCNCHPNSFVILSAAKDLVRRCNATEILRCAQDDRRCAQDDESYAGP